MRLSQPPTLLSLLFIILSTTHPSNARPNAPEAELLESRYHYLSERTCANPCGWSGQVCCNSGQTCSTNSAGQAECIAGSGQGVPQAQQNAGNNGQWQYYTTTYVETDLVTKVSTYSSFFGGSATAAPSPSAGTGLSCDTSLNESPCGTICCATGQYCVYAGQCGASNGNTPGSSSYLNSITSTTSTGTNTAFVRPTSSTGTTVTSTGSATTTVPFQTPSATASGSNSTAGVASTTTNNGLSGGAIAGIVIGVLVGLFLLFLLCACLCARTLFDGIMSFFGLGKRRTRREETYIEERHRHSSGGAVPRTWYGAPRPSRIEREKKSSGVGGLTAVTGGLAALAILLGLKRRRDKRKEESYASGSSYTYSDYTSSSKH